MSIYTLVDKTSAKKRSLGSSIKRCVRAKLRFLSPAAESPVRVTARGPGSQPRPFAERRMVKRDYNLLIGE